MLVPEILAAGGGLLFAFDHATIAGKVVLTLLAVVSIFSWSIMITKLRVIRFTTFDDLHHLLREQLASQSYTALIHAAAVSDYRPAESLPGKLDSAASVSWAKSPRNCSMQCVRASLQLRALEQT